MYFKDKIPTKIIKKVNHVLDNPSKFHKWFNSTYSKNDYNPYDYLDLGKHSAHRKINHDVVSATMAGYMIGGQKGAQAALMHLYADKMSDVLKHRFGARKRDIAEAIFNAY